MSSQRVGHPRLVMAGRWPVRLLLALLVITQVLACQAALAGSSSASATISSQHDVGHDTTCEPGPALATPAVRSITRECSVPFRAGDMLAAIALMVLIGGIALRTGLPLWAPRELIGGRQLLLRLRVIRV